MSNITIDPLVYAIALTHEIQIANSNEIYGEGDHTDITLTDLARIVNVHPRVFDEQFLNDDDSLNTAKFNEWFSGIQITHEYRNGITQYSRLNGHALKCADEYRKDYLEFQRYMNADCDIVRVHLKTLFHRQQESLTHLLDELTGVTFAGFSIVELLAELRIITEEDNILPF